MLPPGYDPESIQIQVGCYTTIHAAIALWLSKRREIERIRDVISPAGGIYI